MNYLLCSENFFIHEEYVWFSAFSHNGLYQIEKVSGHIKSVMKFPGEKGMAFRLYGRVVQNGKYLVFVPLAAHAIAIFNLESNELKMLPLLNKIGGQKADIDKSIKFWSSAAYKNKVFLFGWEYPAIVELDMDTSEMHCYTEWMDELDAKVPKSELCYFGIGAVQGNYVYLPLLRGGFVMRFDMETAEHKWIKVECGIKGFAGVSFAGEDMWLVPSEYKDIIKWNSKSRVGKKLKVPYADCGEIGIPFYAPLIGEKGIYLFPAGMEGVYFIDPEKDIIYRHERLSSILSMGSDVSGGGLAAVNPMITQEGIFFSNYRDNSWHLYHEMTGEDKAGFLEADGKARAYIDRLFLDNVLEKWEFVAENEDFSLRNLLGCLQQGDTSYYG